MDGWIDREVEIWKDKGIYLYKWIDRWIEREREREECVVILRA